MRDPEGLAPNPLEVVFSELSLRKLHRCLEKVQKKRLEVSYLRNVLVASWYDSKSSKAMVFRLENLFAPNPLEVSV